MSAFKEKYYPVFQGILWVFLLFLIFSLQVGRVNLKPWGMPVSWGRSLGNLAVGFAVLWLLGMVLFRRWQVKRCGWDLPIWLLLFFLTLSTGHTISFLKDVKPFYTSAVKAAGSNSLDNYWTMLVGWVVFLAVIGLVNSRRRLSWVKWVICFSAFCFCGLGLVRFFSGMYHAQAPGRLSTASLHPNGVGIYLVMLAPLVILELVEVLGWKKKVLWGGLLLCFLVTLALTFSRTSWLGFLVVVGYLLVRARSRKLNYLIILIVVLGAVAVFSQPRLRQRALTFKDWTTDVNVGRRLTYTKAALKMIGDNPIWGVGYGSLTFRGAYLLQYKEKSTGELVQDPHNLYLNFAATAGLPVLLIFLWLVKRVLTSSCRKIPSGDPERERWRLSFQAGFIGFLFIGLAESPFYSPHLLAFFWFFLALGALVNGEVKDSPNFL